VTSRFIAPLNVTRMRRLGQATFVGGALFATAGPLLDMGRFAEADANPALVRVAQLFVLASAPALAGGVGALVALLRTQAPRAARAGAALAYAGFAATVAGSALSVVRPTEVQLLNPIGSVLVSAGMLVLGISALRRQVFTGWARIVPVLIGAWFFVHIPFQLAFFARPSGVPSHTFMCLVWGPLWALLGGTVIRASSTSSAVHERVAPHTPAS
jgi:hypothetical protein